MEEIPCGRDRMVRSGPVQIPESAPPEPPMRRWPHPVSGTEPARQTEPAAIRRMEPAPQADPMLHYIHCALSYQNQMLADIKALLQSLAAEAENGEE